LRSRRHLTLAGQFLLLQLAVLLVVVVVTSVVSLRQSDADFRASRGARLGAAAESLANTAAVQDGLRLGTGRRALAFYTQQRSNDVGASAVYLASAGGDVLVSTDPTRVGESVSLGNGDAARGRAWTGDIEDRGGRAIAAEVPVYAGGVARPGDRRPPTVVGIAVVTERYPALTERLAQARADVLAVLATGLAVGALGSWLLSRLIRRRTRGLEPAEIAALADQREALLTSIREGVVAVSDDGVVTVVSDSARDLLGLPDDATGRPVGDLGLEPRVANLLRGGDEVRDAVLVVGGRVLVLNGNRVVHEDHLAGTVTTLRDRTELLAMQSELSARESVTETLRAQTHEFSNQLHTISGLLQLEEYDEAGRFVHGVSSRRAAISDVVTARVDDPAVAALLIAKASLAAERRVQLAISPDGFLPRLDPDLSADVGTVLGNLVDNAVDAASDARAAGGAGGAGGAAHGGARVDVRLEVDESDARPTVVVQVADSGPGVPAERMPEIFRRGFSTKPSDASGRGVGLALVQVVCEGRGGSVSVHNAVERERGAVFTARLPTGTRPQQHQTGPA
jgi:sensor histidine kinase regulating citrate/malate metabolism